MHMRRWLIGLISVIVMVPISLPGLPARAAVQRVSSHTGGGEKNWIDLTLSVDGAPAPGEAKDLSLVVFPLLDAPDMSIHWTVPAGVELVVAELFINGLPVKSAQDMLFLGQHLFMPYVKR